MIERGNLWKPKPTKYLNPIKKRPRSNGETFVMSLRFRNGCKNSGKIWWMMKFHYRGALTPSSSHEASLEPTTKRREDLGKHNVHTHFPKDRNCEICKRTKNYKGPVQKTQWRSRTSCRNFWWLDNSRPQGPKRQLRISKQSPICSRGAGSSHSMDPGVSVQKQDFTRNPEKLAKVPGTREETKSHLHWQFLGIRQSLWRSLLESLHVDTTPTRNIWGLRKEQCAEWRKAPLLYCCNRV